MKLLLLFLVLIGVALIDVTQARTIEKKQAGKAELMKMFKANEDSPCKCLNHGYCLERKRGEKGYSEVKGCGETGLYTFCDSTGCRKVSNDHCFCEFGRCEKCDQSGCFAVTQCMEARIDEIAPKDCTTCTDFGCKAADCSLLCNDDSDDILFQDKCTCKKDTNGKETCEMCGKFRCNRVDDCSRFASCKCKKGKLEDSYKRCYGFNHGEKHCKELFKCSEKENVEKRWEQAWENAKNALPDTTSLFLHSCDCPSDPDGGFCKKCDFFSKCTYVEECGPDSFKAPILY